MSILNQSNPRTVESEPEKMDRVGQRQHGGRLLLPGREQNCGFSTGAAFGRWKPSWNPESEYLRVYLLHLWALSFSLPWLRCCLKNYNYSNIPSCKPWNQHPSQQGAGFQREHSSPFFPYPPHELQVIRKIHTIYIFKNSVRKNFRFQNIHPTPPCPIIWEGLS